MPTLDANYWDERYKNKETGWDIGSVSDPLKEYIDQLNDKNIRILIPGGGNSYEALYLIEKGFTDVTVVDISKEVCDKLISSNAQAIEKGLKVVNANFFEFTGPFDLILEQTFFCALDPSLRQDYALKMKTLLAPKGKLVGVLFNTDFPGGPPFGGHQSEYQALFIRFFMFVEIAPCYNSIKPRMGREVFVKIC